ncbi:MAG: putative Ig domain-containing protein, partial [Pseudomonadota bacterium]
MPSHVVTRRSLSKRLLIPLLSAGVLILSAPIATASSAFLTLFDLTYSSLSDSNAGCALCHDQVDPSRSDPIVNNGYGVDLRAAGISTDIVGAFSAVEGFNSDGDSGGCTNIQEIDADAQPGWTGTAPSGVSGDLDPASCGDNPPPVVTNPGDQVSDENENVALQIDASDGDTLSYSAIGLPDGLSINASTGEISGTVSFDAVLHPASFQDYNVEVSVDDGVNTPVTVVFTWTIFDLNLNPIALDDSASTLENTSVDVQVLNNDSDADGDSLAISNVTNPTNGSVT